MVLPYIHAHVRNVGGFNLAVERHTQTAKFFGYMVYCGCLGPGIKTTGHGCQYSRYSHSDHPLQITVYIVLLVEKRLLNSG